MRSKAEAYILSVINLLDPTGYNTGLYKTMFKGMNAGEFNLFKAKLKSGETILQIIKKDDNELNITQLVKIAEKLNIKLFHRISAPLPSGEGSYIGPVERKVLDMPVRRVSQDAAKGVHVPKGNKKRNPITGQGAGDSKGTNLTLPEMRILDGKGAHKVLEEFLSFRSGDLGAKVASEAYIEKYGTVRLSDLEQFNTISGATKMIKNYFQAAHIDFKTVPIK